MKKTDQTYKTTMYIKIESYRIWNIIFDSVFSKNTLQSIIFSVYDHRSRLVFFFLMQIRTVLFMKHRLDLYNIYFIYRHENGFHRFVIEWPAQINKTRQVNVFIAFICIPKLLCHEHNERGASDNGDDTIWINSSKHRDQNKLELTTKNHYFQMEKYLSMFVISKIRIT